MKELNSVEIDLVSGASNEPVIKVHQTFAALLDSDGGTGSSYSLSMGLSDLGITPPSSSNGFGFWGANGYYGGGYTNSYGSVGVGINGKQATNGNVAVSVGMTAKF